MPFKMEMTEVKTVDIQEGLNRIKVLQYLIKKKKDRIEEMESGVIYSGINYDIGPRAQPSGNSQEEKLYKLIELENEKEELEQELKEIKSQIIKSIADFEIKQQKIIIMRHLEFKGWDEIAKEINCSRRWALILHKKIMGNFNRNR